MRPRAARSACTLLAALAMLAALAPSVALAGRRAHGAVSRGRDIAATRVFVTANYRLALAAQALIKPTERRARALAHRLGRQCGGVADGSPQDEQDHRLTYEIAGALWSITYGSASRSIHRLDRALAPLRWSDRKLTAAVRRYAKSLTEMAAIKMPDICREVRAWRASGYTKIPQATLAFDRHVEAIEVQTVPERLLTPYIIGGAERRMIVRTEKIEYKLLELEVSEGQTDFLAALETLGLSE